MEELVHSAAFGYTSPMKKYRLYDHTADIGCEIFGKTRHELFANAVAALFDLMLVRKDTSGAYPAVSVSAKAGTKDITVKGSDLDDLFINFLREILYLFNGKKWIIMNCFPLEMTRKHIVARLFGEPYNLKKHLINMEIKAVTYHGLSIKRTKTGWVARVIFDV